jgi:hypothetical protein
MAALDADFADLVVPPSSCADESPSGRRSRSGSRSKEADPTNLRVWTWASVRSLVLTKTRFEDDYGACIGFF